MSKITAYNPMTSLAANDLLIAVDVDDFSMAPTGTDKNLTVSNLMVLAPVQSVNGSTGAVSLNAASVGAIASSAAGSANGVATLDGTGNVPSNELGNVAPVYQAWQFRPETYGAKGDGKVVGDVVTNSTTTITSASASFTSGDVGKHIMIHGANGATNGPLITTISSVTNSTTAVLANAAGASVSNCPTVYGTDDTSSIQSAITAAGTYALANNFYAEVIFQPHTYMLTSGPTQTSSPQQNSQLVLPYPNVNGTTQKLVIFLKGAGNNGAPQYWESVIPNLSGTCLVSTVTAPSSPSGTYGNQSVIGGPSAGGAFTGGYANTRVIVQGISVWCPIYTNLYAFDFGYVSQLRWTESSAHIFAPTGVNTNAVQPYLNQIGATAFLNSIGSGIRTPVSGNNDAIHLDDSTVEGYECAFRVFDHAVFPNIRAIYSDVAMFRNGTQGQSSTSHGLFGTISAEQYNAGLITDGGSGHTQLNINWDAEVSGSPTDIRDSGSSLFGIVRFCDISPRTPTVSGASNLSIINDGLGPGVWSGAPSAPSSGTAQQNTAWRDATITVTSTAAITAIAVDGSSIFSGSIAIGTPFQVRVPSGHTYTITSAGGTLTTHWVLN